MANLKDIRKRIRSVESTQKITRAMKMVAAARLRKAQARVMQAAPYARKIEELLTDLTASTPEGVHPLMKERAVKKRVLVVMSSDRGLCGAFNTNILRATEKEILEDSSIALITIGRKARAYFARRNVKIFQEIPDFWTDFSHEKALQVARDLSSLFLNGTFDRVDVLYSRFINVISQKPTRITLVPISKPAEETPAQIDQAYEPNREEILGELLPRAVEVRFYTGALNSLASEFGARMTAMDSATRNSEEMIDRITLDMNRARQAMITKELMEIIGGAEAMK